MYYWYDILLPRYKQHADLLGIIVFRPKYTPSDALEISDLSSCLATPLSCMVKSFADRSVCCRSTVALNSALEIILSGCLLEVLSVICLKIKIKPHFFLLCFKWINALHQRRMISQANIHTYMHVYHNTTLAVHLIYDA